MTAAALTFLLAPAAIMRAFTTDPAVIATGASLLAVAAAFQLFDGIQVVATGVLRGTGDTRTAMLANLVGHWALGLPIGWLLAFRLGFGVVGIWLGLTLGLVAVATTLLAVWARRAAALPAH
jgi:MATE family multidrug resistance protein